MKKGLETRKLSKTEKRCEILRKCGLRTEVRSPGCLEPNVGSVDDENREEVRPRDLAGKASKRTKRKGGEAKAKAKFWSESSLGLLLGFRFQLVGRFRLWLSGSEVPAGLVLCDFGSSGFGPCNRVSVQEAS